jgi:hypothetical protein
MKGLLALLPLNYKTRQQMISQLPATYVLAMSPCDQHINVLSSATVSLGFEPRSRAVGAKGFEPLFMASKTTVLPLDDAPKILSVCLPLHYFPNDFHYFCVAARRLTYWAIVCGLLEDLAHRSFQAPKVIQKSGLEPDIPTVETPGFEPGNSRSERGVFPTKLCLSSGCRICTDVLLVMSQVSYYFSNPQYPTRDLNPESQIKSLV